VPELSTGSESHWLPTERKTLKMVLGIGKDTVFMMMIALNSLWTNDCQTQLILFAKMASSA